MSKQQKNRRIGAHMRCTTAARWVAGKTTELENATTPETCNARITDVTIMKEIGGVCCWRNLS